MKHFSFLTVLFFLISSVVSHGQATANFTASVTIIQPVGITTTSDMHFANLDARSGGEVVLSPGSIRSTSGGVELAEGGFVSAASFEVTGEAGFTYSLTLPNTQYELNNGTESIIIRDFTSNYDGTGFLAQGSQKINVGATLEVKSNQTPGDYVNSDPLSVTVNYN